MRRSLGAAVVVCVASATALLLAHAAPAQNAPNGPPAGQIAPAMNLEQIKTPPGLPSLTVTNAAGSVAHLFPTVARAAALRAQNTLYFGGDPPLVYHSGGSIMPTLTIYNIFWVPPTLQNGGSTGMSNSYGSLMIRLAQDYGGHGIDNNNTQYFQTIGATTTYIKNSGNFGAFFVDNSAYPASGCSDSATPGNCITDAQIQAEITKVMGIKGWTGGLTHIFMLYTSSGEGSCFDSTSTSCAYTQYCAYHGFISGSPDVIYSNMPFGDTTNCQEPGIPSPNGDAVADAVTTAASHEITEAVTDPLLNAWFTAGLGYEIGDLCAYDYGNSDTGTFNTYDSGKANQSWNGHFYELQTEFDNHAYAGTGNTKGCVQTGPFALGPSSGL
ncbi:MAG TPA: hypothetical protein VGR91_09400 [Stellaceae bacterium]|nr:hypothetical protein [Stellaceae bacterium]